MFAIRVTYINGAQFFINEKRRRLRIVDNIGNAFQYESVLEFKVSWRLMKMIQKDDEYYSSWGIEDSEYDKENVLSFESVNLVTLETKEIDIDSQEIDIDDNAVYVDSKTFNRLKECMFGSSHWVYVDDWIGFPKDEDYDKVNKIEYYTRGLTGTMTGHENWGDRYDKRSWHRSYNLHHKCMRNPIIQQIYLLNYDSCHRFTIYEETK